MRIKMLKEKEIDQARSQNQIRRVFSGFFFSLSNSLNDKYEHHGDHQDDVEESKDSKISGQA